jgi:hypothetical protein
MGHPEIRQRSRFRWKGRLAARYTVKNCSESRGEVGRGDYPPGLPVGFLFVLVFVASVEDLSAQLSYSFGASFADLARAFAGADADVLAGSRSAFAEIGSGAAGVQSRYIADRSGSAFAQAPRSLGCAFANVLAALAHVLAGAGPGGFLILIMRLRLRLGRGLILTSIRWVRGGGQAK